MLCVLCDEQEIVDFGFLDWLSLLCDGKLLVVFAVLFVCEYLLYGRNPAGTLCSKSIVSREPYSRRKAVLTFGGGGRC